MKHNLIIVGGGASGIIAAITAKDMGVDVAILESNDRIGKKILATGNGRCNITNSNIDKNRYHSKNKDFFINVLNSFTYVNTVDFFYSLGLPLVTLENNKLFPMSLQASSVVDILKLALEERNIPVYYNCKVKNIKHIKNVFKILTTTDSVYECDKLILCCGGKSASKTGSDGFGYSLAKMLGHKTTSIVPALVQLKLNYNHLRALSGIKFNGFAEILVDDIPKRKEFGEILFTDYGISGPPILQLSRIAAYALEKNKNACIKIDLMPDFCKETLIPFLENHWGTFNYRSIYDSFIGIINKKLIPIVLKECGVINIHKPCYELDWDEKQNIFNLLKEWTFEVTNTNSFTNSQVTAGGIDTLNVNDCTLESKLVPNLYFAGEILDVDGDCGGFNLQWAWSSGFVAGKNASL